VGGMLEEFVTLNMAGKRRAALRAATSSTSAPYGKYSPHMFKFGEFFL